MSNLLAPIDLYCERNAHGLWEEPINALTNAAFFIAAYALWRRYRTHGQKDYGIALLIALTALVGLGSFLFHTFANFWSLLADVIPTYLFIFFYLWIAIRRVFGIGRAHTIWILAVFFAFSAMLGETPEEWSFNGSIGYFPSLGAILAFALLTRRSDPPLSRHYGITLACFALSITFRSIDMALCPAMEMGTHFFWHLFNGIVLYRLVVALMHFPLRGQTNRVD